MFKTKEEGVPFFKIEYENYLRYIIRVSKADPASVLNNLKMTVVGLLSSQEASTKVINAYSYHMGYLVDSLGLTKEEVDKICTEIREKLKQEFAV